ncbi:MAG: molybdenum cofactor guanylyltransferase [Synergistaceae bacterium]|jgi:molybdopterin-guanine dinucleotide biosynthesis protein A|nr:molybdenum cofactor guanylyltransferase [Synergistaceae bacterium]
MSGEGLCAGSAPPAFPLPAAGVLLAGGESRRMGRDKALLELDGRPLVLRGLEVLSRACAGAVISASNAEPFARFSVPVVPDLWPGQGPLGALVSVFEAVPSDLLFLAACDMPFLREDAIRHIYGRMGDCDIAVLETGGRLHTLHAFYHRRAAPAAASLFRSGERSLISLMRVCRACVLSRNPEGFRAPGAGIRRVEPLTEAWSAVLERSAVNVNTEREWAEALRSGHFRRRDVSN